MVDDANKNCGDWILERNLGAGGFGIVEFWKNTQSGGKIAIKRCKDATSLSEKQKNRWIHEVYIMKHLHHPNLVKSVKVPEEIEKIHKQVPILCMEYCNRGDLRKFLNEPKNICGIEQVKAIKIMSDILSGVEFLHQNKITHRDLKPENIVLNEKNREVTYKLIDLGYAKELGQDSLYASLVGTLDYVAPELFWNKKYSCSVDYWSLGILFYEVLTGTRPFLPHMKRTITWMNEIQRKKYEHICAHEINGEIILYAEIADPTDLSEPIKEKMVDWFRVALQWDPKKRGKLESSTQLAIFNMWQWQQVSSQKELHVFVASQYRVITFAPNERSTLEGLQQWIEEQTEIPSNQQTITDFEGKLLNKEKSLFSQVNIQSEAPHMIIFRDGNEHFGKLPNQILPKTIERVMKNTNQKLNYHERIQYIKGLIFFINQEIRLSKWYQIALSIKIDLLEQRSITFDENLKNAMESTSLLKSKVEETLKKTNSQISEAQTKALQVIINKVEEKPLQAINQMTKKSESLKKIIEDLRKFSEINWIHDFSILYDKAVQIFREENHTLLKAGVSATTKLLFQFLGLKSSKLEQNKDILKTTQNMSNLEEELSKLEKFLNSAIVLKTVYSTEFQNLKTSIEEFNSSKNESDNLIRDSLLIRHLVSELVNKMQEKLPELLNLDL